MSKIRAKRKKKMDLPSPIMYDPFLQQVFYYNKNGRMIVKANNGVWQERKEK